MPAFDKPDRLSLQVAALRLPPSRQDSESAQTGACRGAGWLSFRRIVYIPFDACVAALEGLLREGKHAEIHVGQSRLRGPIKHNRRSGTCQVEARLARGPLRPALRMRLNIDCWSPPPSRTALELIPRRRVRASAKLLPRRPPPDGLADPLAPARAPDAGARPSRRGRARDRRRQIRLALRGAAR